MDEQQKNWRRITIVTDGNYVKVAHNDMLGSIETVAVLQSVISVVAKQQPAPKPEDDKIKVEPKEQTGQG